MTARKYAVVAAIGLLLALPLWPPIARVLNGAGCQLAIAELPRPAALIFWYLRALGNVDAINNYAVLQRFGLGVAQNRSIARTSFLAARAKGSAAASYNYALTPSGNSNIEIENERRTLLERGAAAGDVHSAAMLGVDLRAGVGADDSERKDRVIGLLTVAAASGDLDYQILLADELWRQAMTAKDSDRFTLGADLLRKPAAGGEPRVALFLSRNQNVLSEFSEHAGALLPSSGEQGWLERAAATGYLPARCQLGFGRYNRVAYGRTSADGADIEALRRSVGDLQACAMDTRRVPAFTPRIFGAPALYADKAIIDYESPIYYAKASNRALADMYAKGLGVEIDRKTAAKYANW